jgi:DNA (cytosine-5)-methyltransferase 1
VKKLNGVDLFSGIGGIAMALHEWVEPVAYCEIDRYAQAVLLSRMQDGTLPAAPIWNDVRTFDESCVNKPIDIVCAGFPCQDISVAGTGRGLEGKRSSLFFEVTRICRVLRPTFVFMENVSTITFRGMERILLDFTQMGYDCRWANLSAAAVGAKHTRERWFCLGYSEHHGRDALAKHGSIEDSVRNQTQRQNETSEPSGTDSPRMLADFEAAARSDREADKSFWTFEPDVGRMVDGVQFRSHRIKSLGNSVVPQQAKEAFRMLMGVTPQ